MDHLKLIVSHSDKNKMNTQTLSQIFGPLFTCHYESDNIHKSVEVFKFLLDMWASGKRKQQQPGPSPFSLLRLIINRLFCLSLSPSGQLPAS